MSNNHQAPAQELGYSYGQQDIYEMQQYGQPGGQQARVLSQQEFLTCVTNIHNEIQSLTGDIHQIAILHQRALTSSDSSSRHQLDNLIDQTQLKNTSIRDQIQALKVDTEGTTDNTYILKRRHFKSLNSDFKKQINNFLQQEQHYKERYREQISRQYRIANPDANEAEVQQAADADWGNEGIFQAALRSNRSGQASAVLGSVRARHNELQKIEQSIIELNGLFQDLDTLIVQQDPIIQHTEEQTEQINLNLEKGNQEVQTGILHALRARRLKWWCLLIVVIIIIIVIIAVLVALQIRLPGGLTGNKSG